MNGNVNILTKRYEFYRRLTFLLLIASQIVFGILDVIFYYQKEFLFVFLVVSVLINVILILLWCSFDSGVRRRRLGLRFNEGFLIVLLGIIGIPAYFWKTRTRREFFISLAGLFLYIIPAIAYHLTWLGTVRVMQFLGYYAS